MNEDTGRLTGSREPSPAVSAVPASIPSAGELIRDAWGALNFILAFYEPGQRYLDTDAWKACEANARAVHKRLAQAMNDHSSEIDQ